MNYKNASFISLIIIFLVGIIAIAYFSYSTQKFNSNQIDILEENLDKIIIQCYALEGEYPPNIKYLSDNYGFIVNEDKYFYYYEIFASNIKPVVEIIYKGEN